ncbi:hypothetical protein KR009_005517, partial [Drosophila setifemur]
KKFNFTLIFQCIFLTISILTVYGADKCNECQENNIKCVNETHFSLCFKNVQPGPVISCPTDQVCTSLDHFCMPKGVFPPTCSEVVCPQCDGSNIFVCTSRTTFNLCDGTEITSQIGKCKDGTVCSISSGKFCVDSCEAERSGDLECDRESPL